MQPALHSQRVLEASLTGWEYSDGPALLPTSQCSNSTLDLGFTDRFDQQAFHLLLGLGSPVRGSPVRCSWKDQLLIWIWGLCCGDLGAAGRRIFRKSLLKN